MKIVIPAFLRPTWRLLKSTVDAWDAHESPRVGAALAYYSALSMAPMLLIAIAVAGMVFGRDAARAEVSTQLNAALGPAGAEVVNGLLDQTRDGSTGVVATIIGLVTLLGGATNLFAALHATLNRIWEVPKPANAGVLFVLRRRFLAFCMVLGIGFLLLVLLVISASLSGLQAVLADDLGVPFLVRLLDVVISVLVTTGLFALLYRVLPDTKVTWRDVGMGAFVTALLFAIGRMLIGWYMGTTSIASAYGAAGSFVVMLVWLQYSAQILLLGAEFTHVYALHRREVRGARVRPGSQPDPGRGQPPEAEQ